jgi:hypothetical protein
VQLDQQDEEIRRLRTQIRTLEWEKDRNTEEMASVRSSS